MPIKVKKILGNYERAEGSKIRVAISNNGKENYLDIREFNWSNEKWVPSKGKGIWIPVKVLAQMNQDNILEMAWDFLEEFSEEVGK